ncbi:DUF1642 domain-containing protein [Lactococcus cremoris]
MTKFEEEFNYLIELSGKVLLGQVDAETFKKNRIAFFEKYETDQQQTLPVVPEFVAEWIEILKTKGLKPLKNPETYEETGFTEETLQNIVFWISEHQEDYMRAWLDGYTVEKPQLFYLKNKIELEDVGSDLIGYLNLFLTNNGYLTSNINCAKKFTQQEIDSMQTGSYELVPVEDGE